jgi:hypothetical protein
MNVVLKKLLYNIHFCTKTVMPNDGFQDMQVFHG